MTLCAPKSATHGEMRVTWVVPNTVEYGRRFRTVHQPISDDGCVTWCQATVCVADDEDVNVWIVDDGESPGHRSQRHVDVMYFSAQFAQSP